MKSALRLASLASGTREAVIEACYRKLTADRKDGFLFNDDVLDLDELLPSEQDEEDGAEDEDAEKFLSCLQRESVLLDPEAPPPMPTSQEAAALELADLPDKEQLEALIEEPETLKEIPVEPEPRRSAPGDRMPMTLGEALQWRGCQFNSLFRLSVRLRSSPGGTDTPWVKNARNVRRASQNLNWHQCLGSL